MPILRNYAQLFDIMSKSVICENATLFSMK